MTGDGMYTFGYSSRNMMLAATLTSTGAKTRYQYDGDGLRALKSGPSGPSYYVHGPGGLLLAEYAGSFSKEWPAAATTGLGPDFTLEWSAIPDATYVVCVDTVNNNACDTAWVSTSSATSKALTDVAAGTYYWQVKATDSGGTQLADAGTWWSFTINAQGIFGKTSPGGGAYVHTNDVTLAWNSLPDVGYWVCWDTTNNDTCDGGWTPNGSNTTKVLESLGAGTYYWQVKETEEDIQADAGQWWSFTKVTGTTGKLAPLDGTTNHGEDVWVSWSAVADAGYWVCWDTSNNNTCDTGWYPNGASTTKLLEDLSAGTYYWQIKVDPDAGADYETNGGEWWAFTVGSGSPPGSGTSTVTREYVYLGSRLLASIESGTTLTYYHVDVLGSVRAITSSAGATLTRHDYAPFGESTSDLDGDPRRFLGQELDEETALDHFGARQYRNVWGRFTAIDPIFSGAAKTNPQLWNRYAYALNGPLRHSDPSGLEPEGHSPVMEEYGGISDFSYDGFDSWAQGLALENMLLQYAIGKVTGTALLNYLPIGTLALMHAALNRSNADGGFRETGFTVDYTNPQPGFSDLRIGPRAVPGQDVTAGVFLDSALPGRKVFAVHVHPKGTGPNPNPYSTNPVGFNQPPSGEPARKGRAATDDYALLAEGGFRFGIVIGAGDGKVYFFDSNGPIGKPIKWP